MANTTLERERRIAALGHGSGLPDPLALAVAAALQARLPDTEVLLFGSRAIGDWRPGSDLDLALIGADAAVAADIAQQVRPQAQALYGPAAPDVQIVAFSRAEFRELRTSLPHLAGQVQRYGLKPSGDPLPTMSQDNPWPGVQSCLKACRRHLAQALKEWGRDESHLLVLYFAQAALEAAVKAGLGAARMDFGNHHDLSLLIADLPAAQVAWLTDLPPPGRLDELTAMRQRGMYADERELAPATGTGELIAAVQRACHRLADETLDRMGKSPRAVGYPEWLADGPLAGWGTLPLDHYAQPELAARERRLGAADAYVATLRQLCGNLLTTAQLDRVEGNWRRYGAPADAAERIGHAMAEPHAWRELLVVPDGRAADADRRQDTSSLEGR